MPSHETLIMTAKFRAAALAYINNEVHNFTSGIDIANSMRTVVDELGMTVSSAYRQFRELAEVGLIEYEIRGRNPYYKGKEAIPGNALALVSQTGATWKTKAREHLDPITSTVESHPVRRVQPKTMPPQAEAPATDKPKISVDIVKDTGKLRFSMEGVTIELGVVDH
jgi:DNA-binding transcriptional ArsR family regulator